MNRIIFILVFLIQTFVVNAQCTFERYYKYYLGISPNGPLTKTIKVSDGGFLTVSSMYIDSLNPGQHGYTYMCAVKNDSCGNTLWKNTYFPSTGGDAMEASNGDYLITDIAPWQQAMANIQVLRIDKNGKLLWNRLYSGNIESYPNNIIKRKNKNSCIVSGFKQYTAPSITNYGYIVEINDTGQVLKSHDFPYANLSIQRTFEINDTTYLMIANSLDSLYIIQTDTMFNVKWFKKPLLNLNQDNIYFYDACLSDDKKSIAMALDLGGNYLARIGIDGNMIANKILSNSLPWATCITPTPNNGFLIGPNLLYTDSNFNTIKYQIIYGDQLSSIVLNQDQSITGSGISNVLNTNINELCIVKIDSNGNYAHSGINEVQIQNAELTIYPNPVINELHIQTASSEKLNVQIFDITGKQIMEDIGFNNVTTINTQSLNQGLYFIRITDADGAIVKTQKVAVAR